MSNIVMPSNYVVKCKECGWKGKIAECDKEYEEHYVVIMCPKCFVDIEL